MLKNFIMPPSIFNNNSLDQLKFNKDLNKVFVYIVDTNYYKQHMQQFWQYLSIQEKTQAKKYHYCYLSDRYIISHGILRQILSYYTQQYPQDIIFTHNEYGKPFFKNGNIYFNISHSHNMISCIVALYRVGIDIELHDSNLNVQELASMVLTLTESQHLSTLKSQDQIKFFYHIWTKKEALIKASGQGLSYPINTIEAMSISSGSSILLTNGKDALHQEWYSYELKTPKNYFGSIAIENRIDEIVYLTPTKFG